MEQVWEILKEYLGEAILFIVMILRTARSGTTAEQVAEKRKNNRKKRLQKKCLKDLKNFKVHSDKLEKCDNVSTTTSSEFVYDENSIWNKIGEENGSDNG